jgi:hypothetical protein
MPKRVGKCIIGDAESPVQSKKTDRHILSPAEKVSLGPPGASQGSAQTLSDVGWDRKKGPLRAHRLGVERLPLSLGQSLVVWPE